MVVHVHLKLLITEKHRKAEYNKKNPLNFNKHLGFQNYICILRFYVTKFIYLK